jgi:hypothetical protein
LTVDHAGAEEQEREEQENKMYHLDYFMIVVHNATIKALEEYRDGKDFHGRSQKPLFALHLDGRTAT